MTEDNVRFGRFENTDFEEALFEVGLAFQASCTLLARFGEERGCGEASGGCETVRS